MRIIIWFLLTFLNLFAASINYQVGNTNDVIFNLAIASICVILLTLEILNGGSNNDNDRSRIASDDKEDSC